MRNRNAIYIVASVFCGGVGAAIAMVGFGSIMVAERQLPLAALERQARVRPDPNYRRDGQNAFGDPAASSSTDYCR